MTECGTASPADIAPEPIERVPAKATPNVQECHISIYHALREMLKSFFFAHIDPTGLPTNNISKGKGFKDENLPDSGPSADHHRPDGCRPRRRLGRISLRRVVE
jgi:hypothetical protein